MKLSKSLLVLTVVSLFALAIAAFSPSTAQARSRATCDNSIVDIAVAANAQTGEFDTLIAALKATNLVRPLDNCGKIVTVFAPTDAAFEKLGLNADNIAKTLGRKTLSTVLLYHIARGELFAADVVQMDMIRMSNGGYVGVDVNEMGAFLTSKNDPAKIISVDIDAANGVIHVIDNVLLP
jgi:uncharacterized surface protein with fasciclin (FAS1) repeats